MCTFENTSYDRTARVQSCEICGSESQRAGIGGTLAPSLSPSQPDSSRSPIWEVGQCDPGAPTNSEELVFVNVCEDATLSRAASLLLERRGQLARVNVILNPKVVLESRGALLTSLAVLSALQHLR